MLRLLVGFSWRIGRQICVDMTSIAAKSVQPSYEACIRSPERSRLLNAMPSAWSPQPEHALMHIDLVHREALIKLTPFRQGPHVAALRMLRDEVSALLELALCDQRAKLGQRD